MILFASTVTLGRTLKCAEVTTLGRRTLVNPAMSDEHLLIITIINYYFTFSDVSTSQIFSG